MMTGDTKLTLTKNCETRSFSGHKHDIRMKVNITQSRKSRWENYYKRVRSDRWRLERPNAVDARTN